MRLKCRTTLWSHFVITYDVASTFFVLVSALCAYESLLRRLVDNVRVHQIVTVFGDLCDFAGVYQIHLFLERPGLLGIICISSCSASKDCATAFQWHRNFRRDSMRGFVGFELKKWLILRHNFSCLKWRQIFRNEWRFILDLDVGGPCGGIGEDVRTLVAQYYF